MLAVADTGPGELTGPVSYDGPWIAIAVALVVAVIGYYAVVTWWGRPRRARPRPAGRIDVPALRASALARLAEVESDVAAGRLPLRPAYLEVSRVVRDYVDRTGGPPARSMALADLRASGVAPLVAVVGPLYPAEFAHPGSLGDDKSGPAHLAEALARAREVVTSWT